MLAHVAHRSRENVVGQIEQLPAGERTELIRVLKQLAALDERLADLHLLLPAVEVRFYLLDGQRSGVSYPPRQLLEIVADEVAPSHRSRCLPMQDDLPD